MKGTFLTPPVLLFLAAQGYGQQITSLTITPVPSASSGTTLANLKASLPPAGEFIIEDSADLTTWTRVSPLLQPTTGLLNWSLVSGPVAVREGIQYPLISMRGDTTWYNSRFYRLRALTPPDPTPLTLPVAPVGRLWRQNPDGVFFMTTQANWRIQLNGSTLTIHTPDLKAKWECWGDKVHENLNGKHIKDWEGRRRTILLPGDTTITMTSAEQTPGGPITLQTISLYDAGQSHRINAQTKTVEMSVLLSRVGEAAEPDGETMRIWHLGAGRYYTENIYVEEAVNPAPPPQSSTPLGITGGDANPNMVNDYYDDPRMGHT